MDNIQPTSITPEQLAAVNAGQGYAELRDPSSLRSFVLIEQVEPTLGEAYFKEKISEALEASDQGEVAEWDVEAVRAELHRRIAERRKPT